MATVTLSGATVLLTGATGGLGRALATELARRGAQLVLTGRRSDALADLKASLPGDPETVVADLSDPEAAARVGREAGPVDVLIANAGVEAAERLEEMSSAQITAAITTNLTSAAVLAGELAPGMIERRRGHVVLISSVAGRIATVGNGPIYTATKWGLRGLGLLLREDWRGTGVSASVVYPGPIADAGMFARADEELPRGMRTVSPAQVVAATMRAIEKDRAEVVVGDPMLRVSCAVGALAPRPVAAAVRWSGAESVRKAMYADAAD